MTNMTTAPEHSRQREDGRVSEASKPREINLAIKIEQGADTEVGVLDPADYYALALWRKLPASSFTVTAVGDMHLALSRTALLRDLRWDAAVCGVAAAAIGIAFDMLPLTSIDTRVDLVMTALFLCALEGDRAAGQVMACVLQKLPNGDRHHARFADDLLMTRRRSLAVTLTSPSRRGDSA